MRALIVTTGRARGSLAAMRALGLRGWWVGAGTPDGSGMVTASRWCRQRHVVPRPRGDAMAFVEGVAQAVEEGGYDIVFGGADDWMAALATYRDRIPAPVAHPPADTVATAMDKVELAHRATLVGLHAPRTEPATDAAVEKWDGPVVVKCRSHWRPGQQHRYRIEAQWYPDVQSATEGVRALSDAGFEPVLQEPIEGRLSALIGLFHEGRLLGRVQQESYRLWPTPSGVSSRAQTVPVNEDLAQRAATLVGDLGWQGLVELQFLKDERGNDYLIDFNGRFYGSMALANAAGPNLPDAWARQALGLPLPTLEDARPGVRFVWGAGDLHRAFHERCGGLGRDLLSTLRWALTAKDSVWALRDPGPAGDLLVSRLRRVARRPST